MTKPQPENILKSPQAEQLLKDKATVERLVRSQDAKTLMTLLDRSAGGGLKTAAEAAMKGDTSQLQGLLDRLMKDPAGAQVVARLNRDIQGK